MAKLRTPIPPNVAAEVMYRHDRTCCVCNGRGLRVQLHHINENPSDHRPENLAVLCFQDHDQTQTRGGFGRHLGATEVKEFRDNWVRRVQEARDRSDTLAAGATGIHNGASEKEHWFPEDPTLWIPYVLQLPALRRVLWATARPGWDSGVTFQMNSACWEVIAGLESIWLRLLRCYPSHHFSPLPATHFVSAWVAERAAWHRALYEPAGPDTGGSILGQLVGGAVMDDLSNVIASMVEGLAFQHNPEGFDLRAWRREWDRAVRRPFTEEVAQWFSMFRHRGG